MRQRCYWVTVAAAAAVMYVNAASSAWNRFRGPDGTGVGDAPGVPVHFDAANVRWEVKLPGAGHSSPVVWQNGVFVTCADETERQVLCLEADTGRVRWAWRVPYDGYHQHPFNSFAASTPAVDETGIFLTWVSGTHVQVVALGHDGKVHWQQELGAFDAQHGAGSSAITIGDIVVVANEQRGPGSLVAAFDRLTGARRWALARNSGDAAYATPTVYRPEDGAPQLILASTSHGLYSIDPRNGTINWEVAGLFKSRVVASPVVAGHVILATAGKGGGGREAAAVRPPPSPGKEPELAYRVPRAIPYVPTPVAANGLVFLWSDRGEVTCLEPDTGEVKWSERLGGNYFSSPIAVNGAVYGCSRKGEVAVLAAAPEYRLLARNRLPEGTHATPAVAGDTLIFRTFHRLLCIGPPAGGK